jgi:hypothetical protein
MKIDELIERLQALKEAHGNIEVRATDYDGDVIWIDEVEFDEYENAICIALPRSFLLLTVYFLTPPVIL